MRPRPRLASCLASRRSKWAARSSSTPPPAPPASRACRRPPRVRLLLAARSAAAAGKGGRKLQLGLPQRWCLPRCSCTAACVAHGSPLPSALLAAPCRRRPCLEDPAREQGQVGQPADWMDQHRRPAGECGPPAVLPIQGRRHRLCGCAAAAGPVPVLLRLTVGGLAVVAGPAQGAGMEHAGRGPLPCMLPRGSPSAVAAAGCGPRTRADTGLAGCAGCREEWVELRGAGVPQPQQGAPQALHRLRRQVSGLGLKLDGGKGDLGSAWRRFARRRRAEGGGARVRKLRCWPVQALADDTLCLFLWRQLLACPPSHRPQLLRQAQGPPHRRPAQRAAGRQEVMVPVHAAADPERAPRAPLLLPLLHAVMLAGCTA